MRLWELKRILSCGHGPSSVVRSHMWLGPQANAISTNFYSCGSHIIKRNKSMFVSVRSAMVSWFCVGSTSKRWFLKIVQVTRNMIHRMPSMIPCRLYIHLAFTYSVGPSSVVWSELGRAPPFPPMRVLEVYGHGLSISYVKWPWDCTRHSKTSVWLKQLTKLDMFILVE